MANFDADTLRELRDVRELRIRTERHPKTAVVIWIVVAGDEVFVRSWLGARGRWYRDLKAGGPAILEFAGRRIGGAGVSGERRHLDRSGDRRIPAEIQVEFSCAGDGELRNPADHATPRTALTASDQHLE